MVKLLFKEPALIGLQSFIRNYEEAFFELYSDSGLWDEALIIQSYQESAQKLYSDILNTIVKRLSGIKVLGRKPAAPWQELTFHVGSRLVIVFYSDDLRGKVRYIESISIDRKPIIF